MARPHSYPVTRNSSPVTRMFGAAALALVAVTVIPSPAAHAAATCNSQPATIVGTAGDDILVGTDGADVIVSGGGIDKVDARGGDDLICPVSLGGGRTSIRGGTGVDTIFTRGTTFHMSVDLSASIWSGYKSECEPLCIKAKGVIYDVENVVIDDGDVTGSGGSNRIELNYGYVTASLGGDTIIGLSDPALPTATLRVDYRAATKGIKVDLAAQTTTGWTTDRLTGVADVYGTTFADVLIGNGKPNVLVGTYGADVIDGHGGNDWVSASSPAARIYGGSGNDRLRPGPRGIAKADGGTGVDMLDLNDLLTAATVDIAAQKVTAGTPTWVTTSFEDVWGTIYADTITGTERGESIRGGVGLDVLRGLGGDDFLYGDLSDDTLDGGTGHDTCQSILRRPFNLISCEVFVIDPGD